jgi:ABC-type phosphonate transport system ATPase subunit
MRPIVQVEGLCKTYGAALAVDEISFEVTEGEIFGMGLATPQRSSAWKACASLTGAACASWGWIRSSRASSYAPTPGCSCSSPTCRTV